jgi:hypothetical protein
MKLSFSGIFEGAAFRSLHVPVNAVLQFLTEAAREWTGAFFIRLAAVIIPCLLVFSGQAATYYIATDGNDGNTGTSTNAPWASLFNASRRLTAGDTLYVRAGLYTGIGQTIDIYAVAGQALSGTASNPITVANYPGESPLVHDITGTSTYAVSLNSGAAYWVFSGITWSNCYGVFYFQYCNHNTITNCECIGGPASQAWTPVWIWHNSQYNQVLNCKLHDWGCSGAWGAGGVAQMGGDCLRIGYGPDGAALNQSWYNLVSGCTLYHGGHDLLMVEAGHNVISSNYFHNEPWVVYQGTNSLPTNLWPLVSCRLCKVGEDAADSSYRSVRNVWQNNTMLYSGYPADLSGSALGLELMDTEGIYRGNVIAWTGGGGLMFYSASSNNCVYANTIYGVGAMTSQAQYTWTQTNSINHNINPIYWDSMSVGNANCVSNRVVNNIIYGSRWGSQINNMGTSQLLRANYLSNPSFVNTNGFGDYYRTSNLPNLALQAGSPCIDAGEFLTTVTSASGSGTSFVVADYRFFSDGNRCIAGDTIQLQGQTATATVTNVDTTTGTLSLSSSLTWTNGQGVALAYNGTRPDIGAFEYMSVQAPLLAVNPPSLAFNSVPVGTTSNLSFTVQNIGGGTLSGTANVAAPFSIVSGASYNLGGGQSQLVTVGYAAPSTPSTNTQSVIFTGGGGAIGTVSATATIVQRPSRPTGLRVETTSY